MDVSSVSAMQADAMAQAKDVALLKKSNDMEKQMADQIIAAIPKVDHEAAPGKQVNMIA